MYHKQICMSYEKLVNIYRLGNTDVGYKFEYNTYEINISMELQDSIILHFVWIFGAKIETVMKVSIGTTFKETTT